MNFTVFYGLLYRYGRRMIIRERFVREWRAEQERRGITAKGKDNPGRVGV